MALRPPAIILVLLLLSLPAASGFVTEIGYDFVEIVAEGELSIDDEPIANVSGTTLLAMSDAHANLNCTLIQLSDELSERFDQGLTLAIGAMNETVARPELEPELSLNRCLGCAHIVVRPAAPCEQPNCTISIETEHLQETKLTYRIRSEEAYTYWIEDPFGTTLRAAAQSSTNTEKTYTPPSGTAERILIIRAENACGSVASVVGFIEHLEPVCTVPLIETEPIHTSSISYRIRAEEPYTYSIETANGTILREPSVSSTDSIKTYTPASVPGERIFIIRANTSCASSARAVGFIEPIELFEGCDPIAIETDPTTYGPIAYRIIAADEYTYSIEDAFGVLVREASLSASSDEKRYTPRAESEQRGFVIRANTSCTSSARAVIVLGEGAAQAQCPLPLISAEPIQSERITYRITSETPYEYAIENAWGDVLREGASETNSEKQYTPTPTLSEHVYTISARNECGTSTRLVGFLSDADSCPHVDEADVCASRIERISELEGELEACTEPEHMTSFYTLAKTEAETYTYRSKARTNAEFIACLATPVARSEDELTIAFEDDAFANATPILIAIENASVRDVRIGTVPAFIANRSIALDEPDGEEDATREAPDGAVPSAGSGTAKPDADPTGPDSEGIEDPSAPPSLERNPIRRAIRTILALIRTNRTVQETSSWFVPVGIGLAGAIILVPGSKRKGTERL